jgi:nucleoside-diphosphate-sugar epimerase
LAEAVQNRAPGARIDFDPDLELQVLLDEALAPLDDGNAHREWNWSPEYDLGRMLDDFIVGLESDAPHGG